MLRVRRTSPEPRIELMPLIDVVFLLLTFFVFSMVLMVRADVLDLNLPVLGEGGEARQGTLITVALDDDGILYVGGDAVEWEALGERVRQEQARNPDASVVIAPDLGGRREDLIRLIMLWSDENLGPVAILGRPDSEAPVNRP
jgi:biopolymer transport protein ExbD